jgi:hypothetical protein
VRTVAAFATVLLAAACSFDATRLRTPLAVDSGAREANAMDTAATTVDESLDRPSDQYVGPVDTFLAEGSDGAGAMCEVGDAPESNDAVESGEDGGATPADLPLETGGADTSGAGGIDEGGTGGMAASGGAMATGGTGGSLDTGGTRGTGGNDTGGTPGSGGITATGGTPGSGGTTATGGAGGSVSLPVGLVAWWKMDEAAGSSTAVDASGNGNNATLTGLNPFSGWTTGRTGGALKCDGSGGALVGDSVSLDGITTGVTISAWVNRLGASTGFTAILSREIGTTITEYYYLGLSGDKAEFYSSSGGLSTTTIPIGIWTHMAATDDGNTARIYVNGSLVTSRNSSDVFKADTSKLTICGNQNDTSGAVTQRWNGLVDDLQLYSRALTATEIANLAK